MKQKNMISIKKLATAGAAAGLLFRSAMPAFADFNLGFSNGDVEQSNSAFIFNGVSASSNTGNNNAGNLAVVSVGNDITTGNATTVVGVTNVANKNVAVDGCGCNDVNIGVGNGDLEQSNRVAVVNLVGASSDTGDNNAGNLAVLSVGNDIQTGNAGTGVSVTNVVNKNVAFSF